MKIAFFYTKSTLQKPQFNWQYQGDCSWKVKLLYRTPQCYVSLPSKLLHSAAYDNATDVIRWFLRVLTASCSYKQASLSYDKN